MRRLLALVLLSTALAGAQGFVQVSRANPRYLELSTGEPYIPIGPNIGWERFATDATEIFARTESRFRALAANGGNFARIWLSHPFYDLDPDAPQAETDAKLARIDRLVALGARHGIRLKLCLEHFRTLKDSPARFPGSVAMGRPDLAPRFGDMTAFFTGERARAWSVRKIEILSARYRDNPTVFGWELWNEINAVQATGWEEWTRSMLPELKRFFPRTLALQSLGSYDSEASSSLYQRFSVMPGNEIAQAHRYLDPGAKLEVCRGPVDVLSADAVTRLLGFVQDRPVLLSEVGAVEANHAAPSKLYEKDREGVLLHDGLFAAFFAGAAGPGQFWHWQDYIEKNDLWFHFARFTEAVRGIDPRSERFQPVTTQHDRLRVYTLRGRSHTLLWIRDTASDWRSELVEGKPAQPLRGITLPLTGNRAEVYDPWTGRRSTIRIRNGSLALPPFRRSLVIRVGVPRG